MAGRIITISGRPGSGKSTVAKELAARLGVDHASAGDFMRELAAERGMTVLELSRLAETDPQIDRDIDERNARLGNSRRDLVIDSRLAWHFIPHSIKVFLDVRLDVAADRIYGAARGAERENVDVAATRSAILRRAQSEASRYREYYGVDYLDAGNYDLVVDTSDLDVPAIVDAIMAFVDEDSTSRRASYTQGAVSADSHEESAPNDD